MKDEGRRTEIKKALEKHGVLTTSQVKDELNMTKQNSLYMLRCLEQEGAVTSDSKVINGKINCVWKLK